MSDVKLSCGCTPDASGYGYCGKCTTELRKKIWKNLSYEDREYDRYFAPDESAELDLLCEQDEPLEQCTCHIHPPCSFCVNQNEDEI